VFSLVLLCIGLELLSDDSNSLCDCLAIQQLVQHGRQDHVSGFFEKWVPCLVAYKFVLGFFQSQVQKGIMFLRDPVTFLLAFVKASNSFGVVSLGCWLPL
jgi:hypothetical protein